MKKIVFTLLIGALLFFNLPVKVMATEAGETTYFCKVFFYGEMKGFSLEKLTITLENADGERKAIECSPDEDNYMYGVVTIAGNQTWKLGYQCFDDSVELRNFPTEISLTTESMTVEYKIENHAGDVEEESNMTDAHGEENSFANLENVADATELYNKFLEITQSLKEDDSNLALFNGFLNTYKEYDSSMTTDKWAEMTDYEHFIKYVLVACPNNEIMYGDFSSVDDFIENGFNKTGLEQSLTGRGISEDVISAIKTCWKWIFVYYKQNGVFFDLTQSEIKEVTVAEEYTLDDLQKDLDEILSPKEKEEIEQEVKAEEQPEPTEPPKALNGNKFLNEIKEHWISTALFVVVGIAFLIFLFITKKKKDKEG